MSTQFKTWTALASSLLLIACLSCSALLGDSDDELLANVSFHILVNEQQIIPTSGTFDFDTKLFKINESIDLDLATIDKRIVTAIEAELAKKGFTRSSDNPNLIVNYAVAVDSTITDADLNEAFSSELPIDFPTPEPNRDLSYRQGVLIIDFVARQSRKHLWRGAITADVRLDVPDREKNERVRRGVQILLSHFPQPILTQD